MRVRDIFYQLMGLAGQSFKLPSRGTVIAYHGVPNPEQFRKQLEFLARNFSILGFDHFIEAVNNKAFHDKPPLLLTFDDADYSFYQNGFPLLKEMKLPSVLFVITELIGTKKPFWWKRVEMEYKKKGVDHAEARAKVKSLKEMKNAERVVELDAMEDFESRQVALDELTEMSQSGVMIANHSHTHPMFSKCESDEIIEELQQVKANFEQWGIGRYDVFAYPNGSWDKVSEEVMKKQGIKYAFLFDHQLIKDFHPMRISRIRLDTDDSMAELKAKVFGLHSWVLSKTNKKLFER